MDHCFQVAAETVFMVIIQLIFLKLFTANNWLALADDGLQRSSNLFSKSCVHGAAKFLLSFYLLVENSKRDVFYESQRMSFVIQEHFFAQNVNEKFVSCHLVIWNEMACKFVFKHDFINLSRFKVLDLCDDALWLSNGYSLLLFHLLINDLVLSFSQINFTKVNWYFVILLLKHGVEGFIEIFDINLLSFVLVNDEPIRQLF